MTVEEKLRERIEQIVIEGKISEHCTSAYTAERIVEYLSSHGMLKTEKEL